MGIFSSYFPLGLGTSRFPVSGPGDTAGIDKSIAIVRHALDAGVNYIDTAYPYSAGMAQAVLKEAFAQTAQPFGVTVKVMHDMDKTADDARRRVEMQLKAMGLDKAAFFMCWTITGYSVFQDIMQKGGIYDGALRLKDEGIIDHICFSAHAPPDDIINIIKSGAFDGATLYYNITNAAVMQPVLDAAHGSGIDVAVMGPLGGGLIAQNPEFFDFARSGGDGGIAQAAMRFAKAHPAVKIVLSGISCVQETDENIRVFTSENTEPDEARLARVLCSVNELPAFCTGCNYCEGCPEGIPVSEIMTKRNKLLFIPKETYNRDNPDLIRNLNLFRSHSGEWLPDSSVNPCTRCGQCEVKCTQNLSIIEGIADMFSRADEAGFSLAARRDRLRELLAGKGFKRVGLYPNGGFANLVIEYYERFFGKPEFEWLQFNSDPKMWGQESGGLPVYSPGDINTLKLDIIVICTYKYDNEIYNDLNRSRQGRHGKQAEEPSPCLPCLPDLQKLHRKTDVPWVF